MPYPFNYGYNTYPSGYTPYSYGSYPQYQPTPQMPQQPMMQNAQQTAPTVQPQMTSPSSIIWIGSDKDAMLYPVAPNNAVALWNQNSPVVYLKQADASGKPSMKIYDLVERAETPSDGSKPESGNNVPYATKEDVAALASIVKGFDGMIASMRGDIDKMSGDLYGLAGSKKKPTKKMESEEES